jgi:prevent-host-death family protein
MVSSERIRCDHYLEEYCMANLNVGIREAKANLSKLLRMVEKGKEVVLTDHGRPVGKLVPIDKGALPLSSRIKEMEETGILEPLAGKGPQRLPPPIPVDKGMAQMLLAEDREKHS